MTASSLPSFTVRAVVTSVDDTDPLNVLVWIEGEQDPPDAEAIQINFDRRSRHAGLALAQKAADLKPGDAIIAEFVEIANEGVTVRLGRGLHHA